MLTEDKIVPVTKDIFLKVVVVSPKPKGFHFFKPTSNEFQGFLNQIRFKGL